MSGDKFMAMGSNANSFSDTITSTASSTQTVTLRNKSHLSASGISKIDRKYKSNEVLLEKPSKIVICTKWFATIIIGGLFLTCLVGSKLSFIGLAAKLNKTGSCFSNQGDGKMDGIECCRSYTLILLILLIPNILNLFRFVWTSLFRQDRKWPTRNKIIGSILLNVLESFGLCLFALKVLKIRETAVVALLMDCVFAGHIFVTAFQCATSQTENAKKKLIFFGAAFFVLLGFGLTVYIIYEKFNSDKDIAVTDLWHVFVSIICLSISWLPWLRKKVIKVDPEVIPQDANVWQTTQSSATQSGVTEKMSYIVPGVSSITNSQNSDDADNYVDSTEKYTHKLMIISSFTKIVAILISSFLLQDVIEGTPSESVRQLRDGWGLTFDMNTNAGRQTFYFIFNISTSLLSYAVGLYALRTQMTVGGFGIPLLLSTPVCFMFLYVGNLCKSVYFVDRQLPYTQTLCYDSTKDLWLLLGAMILLWVAQLLSTGLYAIRTSTYVLQKEIKLFWMPLYNSLLQDQWMLLDRRSVLMDESHENPEDQIKRTKVYICTTMYRETRDEMKQLLESIAKINAAKQIGNRHFESHIIFDGGIKGNVIGDKALQLLSLVPEVLKTGDIDSCTKADFPYGLRLSWALPGSKAEGCGQPMTFVIHLKDNRKVKNKKRWSQIMYMSYILDFLVKEDAKVDDETAFILTTDADVKFTPNSVEALLDLMTRDTAVGAVCARTYPQGEGPLFWYQQFEYAIGHWFQKAAEHIIGSVLCAPGCFSVYRVKALRDIIPTYASHVEKGLEFLTKDMGEDRWLCTLMVQSGWRIDYCAASCNYTNCPADFDEFYTQRRRWVGSTLANLYLLLKESHIVRKLNHGVSLWFLIYQAALLVSTVLGPSTVILIISGGLAYAWGLGSVETVIVQFIIVLLYGIVCLKTSKKTQLMTAKILTFAYALVMMAVVVGTAEQIVENLAGLSQSSFISGNDTIEPTYSPDSISDDIPISITTVYFGGLVGLFLVTGLLHLTEIYCLLQGFWFLLCLPSGYIMLIVYSICNITDRSWGTREDKQETTVKKTTTWYEYIGNILRQIFFCCGTQVEKKDDTSHPKGKETNSNDSPLTRRRMPSDASEFETSLTRSISHQGRPSSLSIIEDEERTEEQTIQVPTDYIYGDEDEIIKVEEWIGQIDAGLKTEYVPLFKKHGYDDTSFIAGMSDIDLKRIGIKKRTQRNLLENRIKDLPDFLLEAAVPDNVDKWLKDIGLQQYKTSFTKCHIRQTKDLEQLKSFERKDIEIELSITKSAHVRRLLDAIKYLRTPTKEELLNAEIKQRLDNAIKHDIQRVNPPEYEFWKVLTETHLKPTSEAFSIEGQLKTKLEELRNTWLMILLAVNSLWLVLISTLAAKINLTVLGSNPVGLVFLVIFGILLFVQFICMIFHRLLTLAHYLARAPYRFGHEYKSSWSYKSDEDIAAVAESKRAEQQCREKGRRQTKQGRNNNGRYDERTPLLETDQV